MSDIIQGSPEWHALRIGKVTASRVADVVAKTKTGWGASRANYMAELIAERLTGEPAERFSSTAMQWGTDMEPEARAAYEMWTDTAVEPVAFVLHPTVGDSGASPDGLVGTDGLVEIKCPNTATHLDTLLGQSVPGKYVTQMQWQMACTKRQWCDFVSYDPRLPEKMQLYVERLYRSDDQIQQLEIAVAAFLRELDDKVDALTARYGGIKLANDLLMAG
jgi:putative phage-type endonuclease